MTFTPTYRDEPIWHNGHLFLLNPTVVFAGKLENTKTAAYGYVLDTYPPVKILNYLFVTDITVGSSSLSTIKEGMTVCLGSAAGKYDYGMARVRGVSAQEAENTIEVWASPGVRPGELYDFSTGSNPSITASATVIYVTVWEDYRVWMKPPYATLNNYLYDGDHSYDDTTVNAVPIVNIGTGYIGFIDPITDLITVEFDCSNSFPTAVLSNLGATSLVTTGITLSASSEDAGYPVENLMDGDVGTTWRGDAAGTTDWVKFDLGTAKKIRGMNITGAADGHYSPHLIMAQWSDDDTDYFTCFGWEVAALTVGWSASEEKHFRFYDAGAHRYWRLYMISYGIGYNLRIKEIEVISESTSFDSILWDVGDGTITVGTSTSQAITATFPAGFRYVRCEITEGGLGGKTGFATVPICALERSSDPEATFVGIQKYEILSHDMEVKGQRMNFRIHEDISSYPEGTLAMYMEEEFYLSSDMDIIPEPLTNSPHFDGVTSLVDLYSASLSGAFNGVAGSILIWVKMSADEWADAEARYIVRLWATSNNFVYIYKSSGNIVFTYRSGASSKTVTATPTAPQKADWLCLALTWDKNAGASGEVKAYINGSQSGSTQTSLNTWSGSLSSDATLLGAVLVSAPGEFPYTGYMARFAIWSDALTSSEVAAVSVDSAGYDDILAATSEANLLQFLTLSENSLSVSTLEEYRSNGRDGTEYDLTWSGSTLRESGVLSISGPSGREHVKFIGWLGDEDVNVNSGEESILTETTISAFDVGQRLAQLPGFNLVIQRDDTPGNGFQMMQACVDPFMYLIGKWLSTAAEVTDFFWSGMLDSYNVGVLGCDGSSIYEMLDYLSQAIAFRFTCNKHGVLKARQDPLICKEELKELVPTLETIGDSDVVDLDFSRTYPSRVHWHWGSGVASGYLEAENAGFFEFTTFVVSPGEVPGQGLTTADYASQLLNYKNDGGLYLGMTVELSEREGKRYLTRINSDTSRVSMKMAHTRDIGIDPGEMNWLILNLTSELAAERGLVFSNRKSLPYRVSIRRNHEFGYKEVIVETELDVTVSPPAVRYFPDGGMT